MSYKITNAMVIVNSNFKIIPKFKLVFSYFYQKSIKNAHVIFPLFYWNPTVNRLMSV
ncbi:hypothetical protein D3C87_1721660 [compost metagenome]